MRFDLIVLSVTHKKREHFSLDRIAILWVNLRIYLDLNDK